MANVVNTYLADRWVVLGSIDKKRVMHHDFLSIKSLRKLVEKMREKK